jgi:hypothetical protein
LAWSAISPCLLSYEMTMRGCGAARARNRSTRATAGAPGR